MNIRTLRAGGIAATVGLATTLAAGCAALVDPYTNTSACERAMRDALAEKTTLPMKVTHTGVGINGSRVVVEGTVTGTLGAAAHPAGASGAAVATGASGASGASGVAVASGASGAAAAAAASAAAPTFGSPAGGYSSGLTANSASEMNAAAAAGTGTGLLSFLKKKKPVTTSVAAECEFTGKSISAFHWLAPAAYAEAAAPASGPDADQ